MFEDKAFRDMMWSFDPTGATFYAALVKEFIDLEFNHLLLMLRRALQDSAKFHLGNPFAQLSHDAAWLSDHEPDVSPAVRPTAVSRPRFLGAAALERRLGGLPLDWAARHVG